jgi:hypothetical protein
VGRELLDHVAVFLDYKDLLAAIATKGLGQGNRLNPPIAATGAGVIGIQVDFLAFVSTHSTAGVGADG